MRHEERAMQLTRRGGGTEDGDEVDVEGGDAPHAKRFNPAVFFRWLLATVALSLQKAATSVSELVGARSQPPSEVEYDEEGEPLPPKQPGDVLQQLKDQMQKGGKTCVVMVGIWVLIIFLLLTAGGDTNPEESKTVAESKSIFEEKSPASASGSSNKSPSSGSSFDEDEPIVADEAPSEKTAHEASAKSSADAPAPADTKKDPFDDTDAQDSPDLVQRFSEEEESAHIPSEGGNKKPDEVAKPPVEVPAEPPVVPAAPVEHPEPVEHHNPASDFDVGAGFPKHEDDVVELDHQEDEQNRQGVPKLPDDESEDPLVDPADRADPNVPHHDEWEQPERPLLGDFLHDQGESLHDVGGHDEPDQDVNDHSEGAEEHDLTDDELQDALGDDNADDEHNASENGDDEHGDEPASGAGEDDRASENAADEHASGAGDDMEEGGDHDEVSGAGDDEHQTADDDEHQGAGEDEHEVATEDAEHEGGDDEAVQNEADDVAGGGHDDAEESEVAEQEGLASEHDDVDEHEESPAQDGELDDILSDL